MAEAIWNQYKGNCTSAQRKCALIALCALVQEHSVTVCDGDGKEVSALPEEWSHDNHDVMSCFVVAHSAVYHVRFVFVGEEVMMLIGSVSDRSPIWSLQLPSVEDEELLRSCVSQYRFPAAAASEPSSSLREERPQYQAQPASSGFNHPLAVPTRSEPRWGNADLMPAGTVPVGRGGGMMVGPNSAIFSSGDGGFGPGAGSMPNAGSQFGRYDPLVPGGSRGGRGRGNNVFPGEPDPDHLRPFNNNQLPSRGGGQVTNGRFNYGF